MWPAGVLAPLALLSWGAPPPHPAPARPVATAAPGAGATPHRPATAPPRHLRPVPPWHPPTPAAWHPPAWSPTATRRHAPTMPPPPAWRVEAGSVTFRIEDRRDPREVAERTAVFVNGHRVGEFQLDDEAPDGSLLVTVPEAPSYEYALCGSITLRTDAGEEMHRVNSAGRLSAVDGHVFEALGAADFTLFYLVDRGGVAVPGDVHAGDPGLCVPATS